MIAEFITEDKRKPKASSISSHNQSKKGKPISRRENFRVM